MAFLDLDEALEELGYGDATDGMHEVLREKHAYALRRQHGRYKLNGPAWCERNARRRKNVVAYRFQWRLPFQPHRVCNTSELLDQKAATRLAHQRAEKWA